MVRARARASLVISRLVMLGTEQRRGVQHHARWDDCTLANSAVEWTTAGLRAQCAEVRRRVLDPTGSTQSQVLQVSGAVSTEKAKSAKRYYRA